MAPSTVPNPVEVAHRFARILESLEIRYVIGGSFASSVHGEPRSTNDVDFLAGDDPFDRERLERRERLPLPGESSATAYVDTAEHSVLRKLEWYRRGSEVSGRQWRDVVAILRIQGDRIDAGRLDTWAERLRVGDLLERARREAANSR